MNRRKGPGLRPKEVCSVNYDGAMIEVPVVDSLVALHKYIHSQMLAALADMGSGYEANDNGSVRSLSITPTPQLSELPFASNSWFFINEIEKRQGVFCFVESKRLLFVVAPAIARPPSSIRAGTFDFVAETQCTDVDLSHAVAISLGDLIQGSTLGDPRCLKNSELTAIVHRLMGLKAAVS